MTNGAFTRYITYMTTTQKNIRNMNDTELRTALEAARARRDQNPSQANSYRLNNLVVETHRRGWGA